MFYCRYRRVVALEAIECAEPEETPFMNDTAKACSPQCFAVAGTVGLGCESRNRDERSRCCFLHPLRKWVLRTPQILAIEREGLSMQMFGAMLRLHVRPANTRLG